VSNRTDLGIHPNREMHRHVSLRWLYPGMILLLASFLSCIQPDNPQDLKEKTAKATEDAKRDAKAVAEGIREGWSRDKPLNLNTATKDIAGNHWHRSRSHHCGTSLPRDR
jgi:hypothetical protein